MNKIKTFITIIILIITFSNCGNEKGEEKTTQKKDFKWKLEAYELPEKVFTEAEIAKFTISAIMAHPPEIVNVKYNGEYYYVYYNRPDDGKKFDYKIKITGNNITWGSEDGRWRDTKLDEKINYSEKDNKLKIIQTFNDGSTIIKEFQKKE